MVCRQRDIFQEFVDEQLVEPVSPSPVIAVKLCESDQIGLAVYVEVEFFGDLFEELLPVHEPCRSRNPRTYEHGGGTITECGRVLSQQDVLCDRRHSPLPFMWSMKCTAATVHRGPY